MIRNDIYYNYGEYDNDDWVKTNYTTYTWKDGNIIKNEIYNNIPFGKNHAGVIPVTPDDIIREDMMPQNSVNILKKHSNEGLHQYTYNFVFDNKKNPLSAHESLRLYFSGYDFKILHHGL